MILVKYIHGVPVLRRIIVFSRFAGGYRSLNIFREPAYPHRLVFFPHLSVQIRSGEREILGVPTYFPPLSLIIKIVFSELVF